MKITLTIEVPEDVTKALTFTEAVLLGAIRDGVRIGIAYRYRKTHDVFGRIGETDDAKIQDYLRQITITRQEA